ncbi:hypothetical protein PPSIR1_06828 [Plesiocystis pacifica SIR-1]|uniref:Uncharacterized protein n=1 Tax=Plesiocystis pacifica SIR-1 TaxID=391625 RepID=A6GDL9_9BACT|nr:hypothetical protein PPSIR1_06828 [Plesiocystis pacifica SIR-1]
MSTTTLRLARRQGQVVDVDGPLVGQHHRGLDAVLELADVAREVVLEQAGLGGLGDPVDRSAVATPVAIDEVLDEPQAVGRAAVAQGRQLDGHDADAVVEVLAEGPGVDHGGQVPVGRADDPDVRADRGGPADALELPVLEHAQQLALEGQGQLADLVDEQRAPVGDLELARRGPVRPRERPALVAEQLVLDQRLGQGGAVDLDEGLLAPRRVDVHRPGDELLAGPALAGDQHGRVGARGLADDGVDLAHGPGLADDLVEGVLGPRADLRLAGVGLFDRFGRLWIGLALEGAARAQVGVEAGRLEHLAGARGQGGGLGLVGEGELAAAGVEQLEHADDLAGAVADGQGEHRARREAGLAIDAGVEARVGPGIADGDDLALGRDGPGDALAEVEADALELGEVGDDAGQGAAAAVDEVEGPALGVEVLDDAVDDGDEQGVELDAAGQVGRRGQGDAVARSVPLGPSATRARSRGSRGSAALGRVAHEAQGRARSRPRKGRPAEALLPRPRARAGGIARVLGHGLRRPWRRTRPRARRRRRGGRRGRGRGPRRPRGCWRSDAGPGPRARP